MSDQYGTGNLGGGVFKPVANDSDSPSFVTGPIAPDAPRAVRKGADPAHPELAAEHRDARILKVADLAGESSPGHDASATDTLRASAHGAFVPSAQIVPREHRK